MIEIHSVSVCRVVSAVRTGGVCSDTPETVLLNERIFTPL
jgi:hypothetical protein